MATNMNAEHLAGQDGSFEPQRSNNWYMQVYLPEDADGSDIIRLALENLTAPDLTITPIELFYQNRKVKVAGEAAFDDGTLTVKDIVDSAVRKTLTDWLYKVHDPDTGITGSATDYKVKADIILNTPAGEDRCKMACTGVWPTRVTTGTLDMTAVDKVLIECTFSIDRAKWDYTTVAPAE